MKKKLFKIVCRKYKFIRNKTCVGTAVYQLILVQINVIQDGRYAIVNLGLHSKMSIVVK